MGLLDRIANAAGAAIGAGISGYQQHAPAYQQPMPQPAQVLPLQATATVTLDSSGNGTAAVGPVIVKQHWQCQSATVSVATNTSEAQCNVYLGTSSPQANNLLGVTATGSTGDTCGFASIDLQPGQQIFAVWSGGDSGQVATLVINGTKTQGPPPGYAGSGY